MTDSPLVADRRRHSDVRSGLLLAHRLLPVVEPVAKDGVRAVGDEQLVFVEEDIMDERLQSEAQLDPHPQVSRRMVLRGVIGSGAAAALSTAGWMVERAQAQEATPSAAGMAEPNAIVVLFGQPTDAAAFEEYYLGTHRPLALQIPGLIEILGGPILGTMEGGDSEHHRIAILRFPGQAELEAALTSPEGQEAFADVPNFATGGATAHLARIESAPATGGMATPTA
jgi:uncharacterized protein (TIGR02118 family)